MVKTTTTYVAGHYSVNGVSGKRFWVPGHWMKVNPKIHARHNRKLKSEITGLEEQLKGKRKKMMA